MNHSPSDGFPYYFDLVKDEDLSSLFTSRDTIEFLNSISEEQSHYRYSQDKWSIKQIVGHITDHERIKMYRAFILSRNELIELWGYDQNTLVDNARFDELTMRQLTDDLMHVRNASCSFIDTLSEKQLRIKGNARGHQMTLEDFLKTIIGHERHHINIIMTKYM